MKKHTLFYLLLLMPIALWGQTDGVSLEDIDLSDVIVIEDAVPTSGANVAVLDRSTAAPTVESLDAAVTAAVEQLPEAVVEEATLDLTEEATLDLEFPEIPTVTEALPGETEVVLELPGQELAGGEVIMANEETISVDFPDEDVRTILRNVADLFDLNLVIPDTLQGRTSIKLSNVTWRQVFEVVLDPLAFTYAEDRNIIRIKSIAELTSEPVDTRVFLVNYAHAEELQESISPLVDSAAGGRIQVDVRSNALVITERPSRMNKIQEIIERLDKATDQVMIESKFIEITNTDVKNIGANWASLSGYSTRIGPIEREWERSRGSSQSSSGRSAFDANSGTTTSSGAVDGFPTPEVVNTNEDVSSTFNALSDIASAASTGRFDTALFSASEFEVILSALKTQDDVKLVSNPTVVTLNKTNAKIAIGERYPIPEYTFNSETGQRQLDEIRYEDIGIKLDVTPQVNSAGFINLQIIPEVSSSDRFAIVENTEIPIIESRRTETTIMIKDGYTLAIGGLVENSTTTRETKVPLLGDLPGLGRLFSSQSDQMTQRNLIIFITAKTLNPDGSTYRDVIDPRVLNDMSIVPSELPGYQVEQEERELLQRLEELRIEKSRDDTISKRNARIKQVEYQKMQAAKEAQAAQAAQEAKEAREAKEGKKSLRINK